MYLRSKAYLLCTLNNIDYLTVICEFVAKFSIEFGIGDKF